MKPKREITLGEMQDECTRIGGICVGIKNITEDCKYLAVCPFQSAKRKMCAMNLADPPRFNEAQTALLKALLDNGIKKISRTDVITFDFTRNDIIESGFFMGAIKLEVGETLDLADMFGKEGADAK